MKQARWMVVAVGLLITLAGWASASSSWYSCTVTATGAAAWGPTDGVVYLRLTDGGGAFTNKWVMTDVSSKITDRMLATALTAMSSGKQVVVYLDAAQSYPTLQTCYLVSDIW